MLLKVVLPSEVLVISVKGKIIHVADIKIDVDLDLALLMFVEKPKVTTLTYLPKRPNFNWCASFDLGIPIWI